MSINWAGAAAGFQGYKEEQRRTDADARQAKADARADQDAGYQDELRGRQRADWKEADRIKAADISDRADINAGANAKVKMDTGAADQAIAEGQVASDRTGAAIAGALDAPAESFPGAAPQSLARDPDASPLLSLKPAPADTSNSPRLTPEVAGKLQALQAAGGMPKARDFNDALDRQSEFLRRKLTRGDLTAQDYASQSGYLNKLKTEGVNDALSLMAQGRYDEAMEKYNGVGAMRGARIVAGQEGVTRINGQDTPTHFVTVANADGTQSRMDVARAQYQLLDMNTQLQHQDKAANTAMTAKHYADTALYQRDELAQRARDSAAGRAIQQAQLNLAVRQYDASTPFGQIAAKEKALGAPMTPDQKATILGVDAMPVATRARLTSLLKEQDQISQAMNKAQADGTWQPESVGGRDMRVRSAMLNQQVADLLPGRAPGGVMPDPANIRGAGALGGPAGGAAPNPVAPAKQASVPAQRVPVIAPAGGVGPQSAAPASPVAAVLGLTGDAAMNAMVRKRATAIETAAQAFLAEQAGIRQAAASGDRAAGDAALQRAQAAREAVKQAIGPIPQSQYEAVLTAVGM
ncbi:hypothetical protein AAKU55_004608 [Oxalobacteraceae bacterium GrIS 1.11]